METYYKYYWAATDYIKAHPHQALWTIVGLAVIVIL